MLLKTIVSLAALMVTTVCKCYRCIVSTKALWSYGRSQHYNSLIVENYYTTDKYISTKFVYF